MGLKHLKSIFTEGLNIPDKSDVQDIWKKSDFCVWWEFFHFSLIILGVVTRVSKVLVIPFRSI